MGISESIVPAYRKKDSGEKQSRTMHKPTRSELDHSKSLMYVHGREDDFSFESLSIVKVVEQAAEAGIRK